MKPHQLLGPLALALVLAACGGGAPAVSDFLRVGNSQTAVPIVSGGVAALGVDVLFLASEFGQGGSDLNGDGDGADNVIHFLTPATGAVTNLAIAGRVPLASGARFGGWTVAEQDQGSQDLSGDGDVADSVLAVFDASLPVGPTNPLITGVVMVAGSPIFEENGVFVFLTSESDLGTDLNGDGGLDDLVVRSFDASNSTVQNSGKAWDSASPALEFKNGVAAFTVSEAGDGLDCNGDADTSDSVVFALVPATGAVVPLGSTPGFARAVRPVLAIGGTPASPVICYLIDEAAEGATNLNGSSGDLDTSDAVPAARTLYAGTEILPQGGIAAQQDQLVASTTRAVFAGREADQGPSADFNGDGDSTDEVPFWFDLAAPAAALSLGVASVLGDAGIQICDPFVIFLASEADQGPLGTNYNVATADTDTSDQVAWFADLSAPGIPGMSTGLATDGIRCFDGESLFFLTAPESANGTADLNLDGDTNDIVPIYYRVNGSVIARGEGFINTDGPLAIQVCPSFIRVWANAGEDSGFGDMNGDGDTDDFALLATRIYRDTGRVWSFNIVASCDRDGSAFPIVSDADTVLFPFAEERPGSGVDANGDGDVVDTVLCYVNSSCW